MSTKLEIDSEEVSHMLKEKSEKTGEALKSQELENNSQVSSLNDSNESISLNENLINDGDFKEQQKLDYVSENLDSALDSESNESDTTTSTTDNKLSETITYQQKILEQNSETIKNIEEKLAYVELMKQELTAKLEQVRLTIYKISRIMHNHYHHFNRHPYQIIYYIHF